MMSEPIIFILVAAVHGTEIPSLLMLREAVGERISWKLDWLLNHDCREAVVGEEEDFPQLVGSPEAMGRGPCRMRDAGPTKPRA